MASLDRASDKDNSDDENDYQDKFDTLIDDMQTMFQTTNAFGVRLDNLDAINIEGRLDAIETSLQAITDILVVPNQNIGDNNGPGAGGGKRRKRTSGKSRKKKRTRKRGKSMRKRKRTRSRK